MTMNRQINLLHFVKLFHNALLLHNTVLLHNVLLSPIVHFAGPHILPTGKMPDMPDGSSALFKVTGVTNTGLRSKS